MPRILCTALSAETGPHFEMLKSAGFECDVVPRNLDLWNEDVLIGAFQGYHGILAGSEPITAKVIAASPDLRVIARAGVGFDAVDTAESDRRGIVVSTTPGVNHHAVAEHAIAMLMAIARGFPLADRQVREGVWKRVSRPRVMGSTLGLIGLGRIGQAAATRGVGLGMKVIAADPYAPQDFVREHGIELVELDELLAQADYISLHLPDLPETKHIINEQSIGRMKDRAVIITTARGPLIDEPALIAALQSGQLRAAGLDVFEKEPLPTDSPLLKLDNVILSGHIAGLDNESHEDTYAMAADTFIQLYNGSWPAERIQNMKGVTDWKW
jgi:phosphoglycerate dehydrogenase-like enzyme